MKYKDKTLKNIESLENLVDTLISIEERDLKITKQEKLTKLYYLKKLTSTVNELVMMEYD